MPKPKTPKKTFKLAVVGTDSLRGQEIKNILSEKKFPPFDIAFYDSDVKEEYSKLTQFKKEPMVIRALLEDSLDGMDLVFLATDPETARPLRDRAARGKFRAIDLHGSFNADEEIPLLVAGVNDDLLVGSAPPSFVTTPHPAAVMLAHFFHRLIPAFGVAKAVSFILQPVSAFDDDGIQELASQSVALLSGSSPKKKVFGEQIAFNILSQIETADDAGVCAAEPMIVAEVRRVVGRPELPLRLSIIQAPVFHTYSLMTYVELAKDASRSALAETLAASSVFKVAESGAACPASAITVSGKDEIFVGRIKSEAENPRAFWVWLVADNLTRGSALNAFELARKILGANPR
jgi:aspartate-semialdehyde dehydrogenase